MQAAQQDAPGPLVRIEEAGLGVDAQVRLVVSGISDPARLRGPWSSSGATVEVVGERLRATSTPQALARAAGRSLGREESTALDRMLRETVAAWSGPSPAWRAGHTTLHTDQRPAVMGVVNVTPDSFSDGGALYGETAGGHPGPAVAHAQRLLDGGADILDVGGESTRPGAEPVDADEELRRVLPVVEELTAQGALVSIDTNKAAVAKAALAAGAQIVNDVSGGHDPELLAVTAEAGAGYVLMHTRGTPQDMQSRAEYTDVVAEVYEFLAAGLQRCLDAGIAEERIAVAPGLGFAKTAAHNLVLLRELRQLRGLGRPVLVGASRKSFLGALLGGATPDERLEGSLACAVAAIRGGACVVRVHDVVESVRAVRVAHAVGAGPDRWPEAILSAETG
jgi:dihydropteroate synthase